MVVADDKTFLKNQRQKNNTFKELYFIILINFLVGIIAGETISSFRGTLTTLLTGVLGALYVAFTTNTIRNKIIEETKK